MPSKKLYWNNQVRIARILYEGRGQGGKLEPTPHSLLQRGGGSWKGLRSVTKLIIIAFPRGNKDQLCSAVRQIILISEACAWIPPHKLEEQRFSLCSSTASFSLLPTRLCYAHYDAVVKRRAVHAALGFSTQIWACLYTRTDKYVNCYGEKNFFEDIFVSFFCISEVGV